jgi:hypothetical protein
VSLVSVGFIILGLIVGFKIFQVSLLIFVNYRSVGKEHVLFNSNNIEHSQITVDIKEPLNIFGSSNEFRLKLLNASLKITTEENIPFLETFVGNNVSKHIEVGKLHKNNVAFDKNDNPFVVYMKVFDKNDAELKLNDYVGAFFPYDGSGHAMIFKLKNKEDLLNVRKIEIYSEKKTKIDILFNSYYR